MATLHFVAGLAGAGKTTLARALAESLPAVLIREDEWVARLSEPIETLRQYRAAASKVRIIIAPLTVDLLKLGVTVVFDFAGNTLTDRRWVRGIFEAASADHCLHYVRVDAETCRQRVHERNQCKPAGLFVGPVTDEQLDAVNRFFVPPTAEEGFQIVMHGELPAPI